MRQLLYISSSTQPAIGEALGSILAQSRRNNAASGVTGLLWTDGSRFLQVLEGEHEQVEKTFNRIEADARHKAHVILHDRVVTSRTFGAWSMALMEDSDEAIAIMLEGADPVVRGTFQGLITSRRAA